MVLVLVQLEQVTPGWWPDLFALAEQLGTDRATLNRSVRKLEDLGLLRRLSLANGGTWFWWVAQHENDAPRPEDEPAWVVRDVLRRQEQRITVADRWEWAKRHGIPRETMRNFLQGGQMRMRERWELVSTPMDCYGL
jgi:hypothetical protein